MEHQPDHDGWRQHGAERSPRIEIPDCDGALFTGEPLRHGLDAGGDGRRLGQPEQTAKCRQRRPTSGHGMQAAGNRPGDGEECETQAQPELVDNQAADRLHHGVGKLKCRDHIGILLGVEMQAGFQLRRHHRQGIARQIVGDGPETDESHDPPAKASNRRPAAASCRGHRHDCPCGIRPARDLGFGLTGPAYFTPGRYSLGPARDRLGLRPEP